MYVSWGSVGGGTTKKILYQSTIPAGGFIILIVFQE